MADGTVYMKINCSDVNCGVFIILIHYPNDTVLTFLMYDSVS